MARNSVKVNNGIIKALDKLLGDLERCETREELERINVEFSNLKGTGKEFEGIRERVKQFNTKCGELAKKLYAVSEDEVQPIEVATTSAATLEVEPKADHDENKQAAESDSDTDENDRAFDADTAPKAPKVEQPAAQVENLEVATAANDENAQQVADEEAINQLSQLVQDIEGIKTHDDCTAAWQRFSAIEGRGNKAQAIQDLALHITSKLTVLDEAFSAQQSESADDEFFDVFAPENDGVGAADPKAELLSVEPTIKDSLPENQQVQPEQQQSAQPQPEVTVPSTQDSASSSVPVELQEEQPFTLKSAAVPKSARGDEHDSSDDEHDSSDDEHDSSDDEHDSSDEESQAIHERSMKLIAVNGFMSQLEAKRRELAGRGKMDAAIALSQIMTQVQRRVSAYEHGHLTLPELKARVASTLDDQSPEMITVNSHRGVKMILNGLAQALSDLLVFCKFVEAPKGRLSIFSIPTKTGEMVSDLKTKIDDMRDNEENIVAP